MMLLARLIDIYSLVVLASIILSWVRLPPDNPFQRIITNLTEPLVAPIRRMLPDMGGFDFSAMLLLIALRLVRDFLFGS
jgi:YggT family protein